MIIIEEKAFQKLLWFRENCNENTINDTKFTNPSFLEVSLMGISKSIEEINHIIDFRCIPQECTGGTTDIDDTGLAIFFEDMLEDEGISSKLCGRVWAHTHPGSCPKPSGTDNDTWRKYFADIDFAVMFILADGNYSCRVKYLTNFFGKREQEMNALIRLTRKMADGSPMDVDISTFFKFEKFFKDEEGYTNCAKTFLFHSPADAVNWEAELKKNVKKKKNHYIQQTHSSGHTSGQTRYYANGIPVNQNYQTFQKEKEEEKKPKVTKSGLIKLLIANNKNNINEFTHSGIDLIVQGLGCTRASLYNAQSEVIQSEIDVDYEDLNLYKDIPFIIKNGLGVLVNNVFNLNQEELTKLCVGLGVRKQRLNGLVNEFIRESKSNEQ